MKKEKIMAQLQKGHIIEIRYKDGNTEVGYFLLHSDTFIAISNNSANIDKHYPLWTNIHSITVLTLQKLLELD